MGLPSVAAYTLVAVLVAPAIVKLGVEPLAAHLFVFYFSIVSNFTPPVAMACFAAAPIAQSNIYKIGFKAVKLGLVSYFVPFMFVYAPEMLLQTGHLTVGFAVTVVTAVIACFLLGYTVEGFIFKELKIFKRVLLGIAAIMLFIPLSVFEYSWALNLIALLLAAAIIANEWRVYKKQKVRETAMDGT
jgi:TRAP-type uncharacterized transport system fused permease subunit